MFTFVSYFVLFCECLAQISFLLHRSQKQTSFGAFFAWIYFIILFRFHRNHGITGSLSARSYSCSSFFTTRLLVCKSGKMVLVWSLTSDDLYRCARKCLLLMCIETKYFILFTPVFWHFTNNFRGGLSYCSRWWTTRRPNLSVTPPTASNMYVSFLYPR